MLNMFVVNIILEKNHTIFLIHNKKLLKSLAMQYSLFYYYFNCFGSIHYPTNTIINVRIDRFSSIDDIYINSYIYCCIDIFYRTYC